MGTEPPLRKTLHIRYRETDAVLTITVGETRTQWTAPYPLPDRLLEQYGHGNLDEVRESFDHCLESALLRSPVKVPAPNPGEAENPSFSQTTP